MIIQKKSPRGWQTAQAIGNKNSLLPSYTTTTPDNKGGCGVVRIKFRDAQPKSLPLLPDAFWFAAHPHRNHRLRPFLPGDEENCVLPRLPCNCGDAHGWNILIRWLPPDTPFGLEVPDGSWLPQDEEAKLARVWDLILARHPLRARGPRP